MAPADDRSCRGTRADGAPCRAPANLVGPDGWCPSHAPGASARLSEIGRRGAEAAARKRAGRRGLNDADLPPLTDHFAAETWCDVVGRAVARGDLGHNEGRTVLRAVKEWRESRGEGAMSDRLEALTEALAEWKRTGDPAPVLELVE